jgi:hypothetical protein
MLLKSATSPISIEKFLSPEIGSETDLKSLKSVRQPKSFIEIGSLNQPLEFKITKMLCLVGFFGIGGSGPEPGTKRA